MPGGPAGLNLKNRQKGLLLHFSDGIAKAEFGWGTKVSTELARKAGNSCKALVGYQLIWIGVKV